MQLLGTFITVPLWLFAGMCIMLFRLFRAIGGLVLLILLAGAKDAGVVIHAWLVWTLITLAFAWLYWGLNRDTASDDRFDKRFDALLDL